MSQPPAQPKPRTRWSSRGHIIAAWALFFVSGGLILLSPGWCLCIPLWVAPVLLSLIAAICLVFEFRKDQSVARRRAPWVLPSLLLFIIYLCAGGDALWFRWGVQLRLRHAGGIEEAESWVSSYITTLQAQWDKQGGLDGLEKLDDNARKRFYFVPKDAIPNSLDPLVDYLPMRLVEHDSNGRPKGITFQLSGWDHCWSLVIDKDPHPDPSSRWCNNLTERSQLWCQP